MINVSSPICTPPHPISERQIIFLDGIRYSADMADTALERLWKQLCFIDSTDEEIKPYHIATAALDAWSIIDAAHRMSDLVENLPGLPNSPWRRLFLDRTKEAREFRNMWQHQNTEAPKVVEQRGQAWGSLAWVQHDGTRPTGNWFLMVAGSTLAGSRFAHAGPANAIPRVNTRRIRLLHRGSQVYLGRLVRDMFEAIDGLENDLENGKLPLKGDEAEMPRPRDWVASSQAYVIRKEANIK